MTPLDTLISQIDAAAAIAGSQRKLADLLELDHANLVKIKNGERPCNWRIRGKLRAVLGEDPARAFMEAMAEDLAGSANPDELSAAESFRVMLAAFPEDQKAENPASLATSGASVWRKRMFKPHSRKSDRKSIITTITAAIRSLYAANNRSNQLSADQLAIS